MTIREWFSKHLIKNGLWPHDAEAVLAKIETDATEDGFPSAKPTWLIVEIFEKNVEDYPPHLFAVMTLVVNNYAVTWIDANKPNHFARRRFL